MVSMPACQQTDMQCLPARPPHHIAHTSCCLALELGSTCALLLGLGRRRWRRRRAADALLLRTGAAGADVTAIIINDCGEGETPAVWCELALALMRTGMCA